MLDRKPIGVMLDDIKLYKLYKMLIVTGSVWLALHLPRFKWYTMGHIHAKFP